jgi:hypothetical protein
VLATNFNSCTHTTLAAHSADLKSIDQYMGLSSVDTFSAGSFEFLFRASAKDAGDS